MEEIIEDYLEDKYKNIRIEVKFVDFRIYNIKLELPEAEAGFNYTYDTHYTFDFNMYCLEAEIDRFILKYFKVGEEKCMK